MRDLLILERKFGSSVDNPFGLFKDMIPASEDDTHQGLCCYDFFFISNLIRRLSREKQVVSLPHSHHTMIFLQAPTLFQFQTQAQNWGGNTEERFPFLRQRWSS